MNTKIKVLVISTVGLGYGGISSVIYNYSDVMKRDGVELHIISYPETRKDVLEKFARIGVIHILPERKVHPLRYLLFLNKLLAEGFDDIHIHGNSGTMVLETLIAKIRKIKNIIVHCHNTACDHPIINRLLKKRMMHNATHLVACSKAAGEWLYQEHDFIILNNGINLEKYKFNLNSRSKMRKELCLQDEILIGHVGNFSEQKNHTFLIEAFYEFHKIIPDSKLIMVGAGALQNQIENKVKKYNISEDVFFMGQQSNVADYYQAMDIFILPSLWEGLPLVILEAQAAGLPVLAASAITEEAKCLESTYFMDTEEGAEAWAKMAIGILKRKFDRSIDTSLILQHCGFDINVEANKLRRLYLNKHDREKSYAGCNENDK